MSEAKVKKSRKKRPVEAVKIPVLRVVNPLNPREFVREELAWAPAKTLLDYFPVGSAAEMVVSVNGKIVPPEQFASWRLERDDNIVMCPVPTGGDSGKSIMRVVAMIAITYFTAGWGTSAAASMGLTGATATVAAAAMTIGINMAGAMLVNAIIPPAKATKDTRSDKATTSYGIDGAKNTAIEGIPVPVCYGKFRMGGNILSMYTRNVGPETQYLYMLICAGEGPIGGISDIEINDAPIDTFKEDVIATRVRLGLPDQTPIEWFNDTITPHNKGAKVTEEWAHYTTQAQVDKFRLDFVAPSGMFSVDEKTGDTRNAKCDLAVEYRPKSGGESAPWTTLTLQDEVYNWSTAVGTPNLATGEQFDAESGRSYTVSPDGTIEYLAQTKYNWKREDGSDLNADEIDYLDGNPGTYAHEPTAGKVARTRVPTIGGPLVISGSLRSAVRRSFMSPKLDNDQYEIRVKRTNAESKDEYTFNQVYLSDINDIQNTNLAYPNTALLGLAIRLGDQVSGVPKVTYINQGRLVQVHGLPPVEGATKEQWHKAATSNPAWAVWDMLTEPRFAAGMPASRLDFNAFKSWASHCDTEGLEWNGVFESEMNIWDASQLALRCGHAQLINVGTRWTVIVERQTDPVMMFSVANMEEGSYKESWLSMSDRANEVEVTYFDKSNGYKSRTVRIYDPAALTAGQKQRSSAVTLYGVTDSAVAYREGQLQMNMNRYVRKTVTFSAPMEAIACSVGDVILVQNDMTDWAVAGRFEAGSTASVVQLDRAVTIDNTRNYKLLAMFDAVKRAEGSVVNVVGDSLFLSGFDGQANVKRIKVAGRDLRVLGTFLQGDGAYGVVAENALGLAPGATYELWDTDVIEERAVTTGVSGESTTLVLKAPLSSAPAQFANWMFGESERVKQPFRVKSMTSAGEYSREITAVEYNERVYDLSRFDTDAPAIPPKDGLIEPVRSLSVYEETYISGNTIATKIVAAWAPPAASSTYAGADVYVKRNDGPLEKLIDAANRTSAVITGAKGDVLTIKVVAYDLYGKRSDYAMAPQTTYTVIGELPGIAVGGVTGAGFTWAGRDCKINWRYNSVTHSYEFGSEPTGADAGSLDPHFKDYEIRVYDKDDGTLRRSEYTTDNSYAYTYDKNHSDGLTRHLVFEVRMRDIFNNLGDPATLEAYNPPPSISTLDVSATFESATVSYVHSGDADFAGARIYLSRNASDLADPLNDAYAVYSGPDTSAVIPSLMFDTEYFVRVAAFDAFGPTELLPTPIRGFKTAFFNIETIEDAMLPIAKFAKGIDPVGIVDVLPDPATHVRPQVVLLSTDGKLYRLVDGAWTAAVPAVDIDGELNAAQIADAAINTAKFAQGIEPVSIVDALPAAAGYDGPKVVMLTADGKMYRFKDGAWTSAIPAVDVTGKLTNEQLEDIAAAKIAGKLTNEQLEDIAAAKISGKLTNDQLADIAASKISGQLTSAQIASIASTKVSGQLTDAQIAAVAAAKLTGQITGTQITDSAISTAKIAAGAVTANSIAANAVVAGKIAADAITSATIEAGAITTAKIAAGAVTAGTIAANAITSEKINAHAIVSGKIATDAVTAGTIAAGSITSEKVDAGAITAGKIAAGAVTAGTIAANAVTAEKINAGAISAGHLTSGSITTEKIAADAITSAKIAAGAVTASEIAANTITAGQIAANAITSAVIAAGAIRATEIAAGAISTEKLAAGAITADKIQANAITSAKINAEAITAEKISANAITSDKLAANSIVAGKIAAGAISATEIAAGAISAEKLAAGQIITKSAQIGDGIIVAAKIGNAEITSLKIAGEAVTVPIAVSAPDRQRRGQGENSYAVVNEGYMQMDQDGMLYVLVTAAQGFYNNSRPWRMRIRVNGQIVRHIMGGVANDCPAMSATVPAITGVNKVEVLWAAHNDVILGYCDIFMMGVKK